MRNILRRYSLVMLMLAVSAISFGQSSDHNYVLTRTHLSDNTFVTSVQYYDGLGRPTLSAADGVGQNGNYVYSLVEYDKMGRDSVKWLPAVDGLTSDYIDDISGIASSTYSDNTAYSITSYDVLGRPLFVSTPGDSWQGKGKSAEYITNDSIEVKYYYTTDVSSDDFTYGGYYAPCTLTGEVATDEDGHRVITFKNKRGDIVMERKDDDIDTYYVYSYSGLLRFVLTPEYFTTSDVDALDKYAYSYKYNTMNMCTEKKLPGCESTTYVYDSGDRLIITQDPILRDKSLFRFTLYDTYGRLALQGTTSRYNDSYINSSTATAATGGTGHYDSGYYFCQDLFPDGINIEIINFYDNYRFFSNSLLANNATLSDELNDSCYIYNSDESFKFSRGSLTGQIVATTDGHLLYNTFYYDKKGRVVDERHSTLSGDVYQTITRYSITDKPTFLTKILSCSNWFCIYDSLKYNRNDKLDTETITIGDNNDEEVISHLTYTDLGQISSDSRACNADVVNYYYDIHGWTKDIASDHFTEKLFYADGPNSTYHCYNGNISSQLWQNNDSIWHGYKFRYNTRDMLYLSSYGEGENLSSNLGRYNENITQFNRDGSIVRLIRRGKTNSGAFGIIDNLTYDYVGTKVTGITDRYSTLLSYNGAFEYRDINDADDESDFDYNDAGLLIKDLDKGISNIIYNNIGLVDSICFSNGSAVKYVYSLNGEKLRVTHYTARPAIAVLNSSTLNSSRISLQTTTPTFGTGTLSQAGILRVKSAETLYLGSDIQINTLTGKYTYLFDGGYSEFNPTAADTPRFFYYTKDHLGNIRNVLAKNGSGDMEEIQRTSYYPFGGIIADLSTNRSVQNRTYNGKEQDFANNLFWLDYGARQYDPTRGQFTTPDPLAEKYYSTNYFTYCMNNPMKFIDPDGREVVDRLYTENEGEAITKNKFLSNIHDLDNAIIFMGHGTEDFPVISVTSDNILETYIYDAPTFSTYLSLNSEVWQNKGISADTPDLVLFSCQSGKEGLFAEELSKNEAFKDIKIYAPMDDVTIQKDGTCSVDNNKNWAEYVNGEIKNEFNGTLLPGTEEFNNSSYWEKLPLIW